MNLTSLAQAKDEVFGPVGTPERDRYEEELAKEIEKAIKKGGGQQRKNIADVATCQW